VKREDLSSATFGGNKVRALEFLLGGVAAGEGVVTVLEVSGGQVRLGIEAPRSHSIYRQELADAIARENRGALATDAHAADILSTLFPPAKDAP
jgi:carbon storage regulator